jgi:hypothetical protein
MSEQQAAAHWETDLAGLLNELSSVQTEVLEVLGKKREMLLINDVQGMAELQPIEEQLIARLQACHDHRGQLLALAGEEGLPNENIRTLAQSLPRSQRQTLEPEIQAASTRARMLQHQSLTNWVVVQRTLLHLSQIVEIIATGGRPHPTYGMSGCAPAGGSLLDQAG